MLTAWFQLQTSVYPGPSLPSYSSLLELAERLPCGLRVFPMKPSSQLSGCALLFSGQQLSSSVVNCNKTGSRCWGGILTASWLARGDLLFGQGFWLFLLTWKSLCGLQGSGNSEWSLPPTGGGGGGFISSPLCLFFCFVPFSRPCLLPPCLHRERIQCILFLFCCCKHFFFFLAMPGGMWNPSSLTRDRTHTPCIGSRRSCIGPPGKCPCFVFIEKNFMNHVTEFKVRKFNVLYGILSRKIKTNKTKLSVPLGNTFLIYMYRKD